MSTSTTILVARNSRCALFSCLTFSVAAALLVAATPARADLEPLMIVPIHANIDPGASVDLFFSEIPDPIDHKHLTFDGIANTIPGVIGELDIQFDWFDPNANAFLFSPIFPVQVIGGAGTPFALQWDIPFCPPEVSLHMTNVANAAGVAIQVDGTFTYQCIPEPSSFVLLGLALLGLVGSRLRKRFL